MQGLVIKDLVTRAGRSSDLEASPSCTIFISDLFLSGEIPEADRGGNCWFTSSCVAIGCISFMDGEVKLTLKSSKPDLTVGTPIFDGFIKTPSRVLVVSTPENNILMQSGVRNFRTRVQIRTNDPAEPNKIDIVFD